MLNGQHRLDESADACCRVHVSDIRFRRADGAKSIARGSQAEGLRQRCNFDGIAE